MAGQVMDTIREIAGMDPGSRNRPQEGVFRVGMPNSDTGIADMDFSVTTCPTLAGENMTIKRIGAFEPVPDLGKLPLDPHTVSSLKQVMTHTSGIFLVASPPGNSRTGTLYGMLRQMHHPDLKAVTVEGTVSFSMPEAVQIQANPATNQPHDTMLRTAIRLDPDLLLAGALADPESAALGLEAARKGIRLLAGIHATDSAGAITALATLDMPPVQTASLLRSVLAQRWVRKICPGCKQTYTPAPEEWRPLFEHFPEELVFHRGAGCTACDFSGYRGRILLSELLVINDTIARAIKQRLGEAHIRHLAIRSGVKTLIDDGLSKLHLTTLQEIVDAVPPDAAEVFRHIRADEKLPPEEENTPAPEEGAYGITLRDPGTQAPDIQRLHHAYEVLMEEAGRTRRRSDISVFGTFIRVHYDALCREHGTDRIYFSVWRKGEKVVLLASPA
jgi:type II secretory ATPase GspE/PulE/Tfp pilus assembly ATPase PilB-like protein